MTVGEAFIAAGYAPVIGVSPPVGASLNGATEDELKPDTYRCRSACAGDATATNAPTAAQSVATSFMRET
jgi:hypothetical protein